MERPETTATISTKDDNPQPAHCRCVSRTHNSVRNSAVASAYFIVMLTLEFFSRKVFLAHLGADILGLNSTASNLLQALNIAELGIGAAIGFSLYRPLMDGDRRLISSIISLQGAIYRRTAAIIGAGATLLMAFFPLIFKTMTLPLWYAYASFGVMLWSALLGYFVNYRQVILTADQQDYKVCLSYRTVMIVKTLLQMWAVSRLSDGYIWWLILEGTFAAAGAWAVDLAVRRSFPYLTASQERFQTLRRRFPDIELKVRQLFFHKIAGFSIEYGTPLIIYAFGSLASVTAYINYYIIIRGGERLMGALFDSANPSVGNLVAEGDQTKVRSVFAELFSARFFLSAILVINIYLLAPPFVTLWLGPSFLLPRHTLALMCIILYIGLTRFTTDAFRYAFGLFSDTGAPVAETILSLGLSSVLGMRHGLDGILSGFILAQAAVIVIWKPYYLITRCMKGFGWTYIGLYAGHTAIGCAVLGLILLFFQHSHTGMALAANAAVSAEWLLVAIIVSGSATAILLFMAMFVCIKPFRRFTARITSHLK